MSNKSSLIPRSRRPGRPIAARVERAPEALAKRAEEYADLHLEAAKTAARKGNAVPAQWPLEHVVARDNEGNELRPIGAGIDRPGVSAHAPEAGARVFIGVNLGSDVARLTTNHPARELPAAQNASIGRADTDASAATIDDGEVK